MSIAEPTAPLQRGRPFGAGQSGNPAGRPKGSRNKLSEMFLSALSADFAAHGPDAIYAMRDKDPAAYCKVVASLLPKELTGEDGAPLFPNVTILFGKDAPSE